MTLPLAQHTIVKSTHIQYNDRIPSEMGDDHETERSDADGFPGNVSNK